MPQPLALSAESLDALNQLAAPIAWGQRDQFLRQVADALAAHPEPGPGLIFRIGRELQRNYTIDAQREAGLGNPLNRKEARRLGPEGALLGRGQMSSTTRERGR
jgi:hypothetical protein